MKCRERLFHHSTGMLAMTLAALNVTTAAAQNSAIEVNLNGYPLRTSVPPMQIAGRVMMPMRDIFEALGATVQWNAANQTITATKDAMTINLWMNSRQASVNGQTIILDQPPSAVYGRIMLPLRFVSEALGADVNWNAVSRRVSINTGTQNSTFILREPLPDASTYRDTPSPGTAPRPPAPAVQPPTVRPPNVRPPANSTARDNLDDLVRGLDGL